MGNSPNISDEIYLGVWEVEQAHGRLRWSITTFFFGISFAITGFAFQHAGNTTEAIGMHATAILVYWFGFFLFMRFFHYGKAVRSFLQKMEQDDRTTIKLHSFVNRRNEKISRFTARRLLVLFGLIYSLGSLGFAIWL